MKDLWLKLIKYYKPVPLPTDMAYEMWCTKMQRYTDQDMNDMFTILTGKGFKFGKLPATDIMAEIAEECRLRRISREKTRGKSHSPQRFSHDSDTLQWKADLMKVLERIQK